jgi:hypothetical protein
VPKFIVKTPERTVESDHPLRIATAFSVTVVPTSTADEYTGDVAVGVDPSIV